MLAETNVVGVGFAYGNHRMDKDLGTAERGEGE